jgi:GNAT superfamily N-acetyltransferase
LWPQVEEAIRSGWGKMTLTAKKVKLQDIQSLRALFLQEANFQIRYDARHTRGWADEYLLSTENLAVGYGSIKGQELESRDTVFEFFVLPPFRKNADGLFRELLAASGAKYIESQSNDLLLPSMLFQFSISVKADVVLFEDHAVTEHVVQGAVFRPRHSADQVFEHRTEPVGDHVIEVNGEVVATGGFLLHYNPPFADLYMEVREDWRCHGIGTLLLQELKKQCYLAGRVPAARCSIRNIASRATLSKAGLRVCGFMLTGTVATEL